MILKNFYTQIVFPIKVISILLISSGISLEIWNIYASINHQQLLFSINGINVFLWLARFALISHFLEAIIASIYASSKNRNPLKYGIYTFFVGTIGLLELFRQEDKK
jgi:hypothetical protein